MSSSKNSRRTFIKTTSAGIAGITVMPLEACLNSVKKEKPNLLFLWTDEQRADTLEAYGNYKIKTPNLNRFAKECFVFRNTYVTQAVSTPSRSSIMTGLYPHTNGCTGNNIPLKKETKCLPELINDPEYSTGYFGKWHLGDEIFAQHGFKEWEGIEDGYRKYYSEGKNRNERSSYHKWLIEKGYKPDSKNSGTFSRGFAAKLPLEHCKPKFLEKKACAFLEQNRETPFILYVNFLEPHMPFYGPLDNLHTPEEIDLPENFNDPLDDTEQLRYRFYGEQQGRKFAKNEKEYRELIARYWGLCSQVDRSVGAILNKLEKLGLADNTIVVYTSDHGDMMGSHRMMTKQFVLEEAAKVPFLMRVPQLGKKQTILNGPVSQVDIVPTLMELMGKSPSAELQGRSLLPLMKGKTEEYEPVFIEWSAPTNPEKPMPYKEYSSQEVEVALKENSRTVIHPEGWKLTLSDRDNSTLYYLPDDPLETNNLFPKSEYKEKIEELTVFIKNWQKRTKDTLLL